MSKIDNIPQKSKDAFWFKHDANAKDDPKIMVMMADHGVAGYGTYWILVECLRTEENYMYPLKAIKPLAKRFDLDEQVVDSVIRDYGLFEVEVDHFYSQSLLDRMEALEDLRRKRSEAGKRGNEVRWGDNDSQNIANGSQTDRKAIAGVSQSFASREEESRVEKKRKEGFPSPDKISQYAKENGYDLDGEYIFNYYQDLGFKDSQGNTIKNWKNKLRRVWFKPEHRLNGTPTRIKIHEWKPPSDE